MTQTTRSKEIADLLCKEVLQGQYRPGERLPSERELAARFQVNRGAVREALKQLEQLGITAIHPGGVRVVPIEEASLDVLGHMMALDDLPDTELVKQMFEVSAALIAMSIRRAVEQATDLQINEARKIVKQIQASARSISESRQLWRELGDYFNEINGNLVLRLIANGLKAQFMGRMEGISMGVELDETISLKVLTELDQAIANRDQNGAAEAALAHFSMVREKIIDILIDQSRQQSAIGAQ